MTKIRMTGMPNDYGLVEETDLNVNNVSRRIPIKRRLLADDEKIYGIQRLWTSNNSKFLLIKKAEYSETNNNKTFTEKSLFRSLTRQKSIDRGSREGKTDCFAIPKKKKKCFLSIRIDLHLDHQSKQRTTHNVNPNPILNGSVMNNRAALASTPPIPKNYNNKRSLKTILSTIKS